MTDHTRFNLKLDEKGVSLIDYALLSAFFALVMILLLTYAGNKVSEKLNPQIAKYHEPDQTIVWGEEKSPQ